MKWGRNLTRECDPHMNAGIALAIPVWIGSGTLLTPYCPPHFQRCNNRLAFRVALFDCKLAMVAFRYFVIPVLFLHPAVIIRHGPTRPQHRSGIQFMNTTQATTSFCSTLCRLPRRCTQSRNFNLWRCVLHATYLADKMMKGLATANPFHVRSHPQTGAYFLISRSSILLPRFFR